MSITGSVYRGYDIIEEKNLEPKTEPRFFIQPKGSPFYNSFPNDSFKTEEEAMNKIDNIERERIERDNANIQRIDNQVKR